MYHTKTNYYLFSIFYVCNIFCSNNVNNYNPSSSSTPENIPPFENSSTANTAARKSQRPKNKIDYAHICKNTDDSDDQHVNKKPKIPTPAIKHNKTLLSQLLNASRKERAESNKFYDTGDYTAYLQAFNERKNIRKQINGKPQFTEEDTEEYSSNRFNALEKSSQSWCKKYIAEREKNKLLELQLQELLAFDDATAFLEKEQADQANHHAQIHHLNQTHCFSPKSSPLFDNEFFFDWADKDDLDFADNQRITNSPSAKNVSPKTFDTKQA